MNERQIEALVSTKQIGFNGQKGLKPKYGIGELLQTMRAVHDLSADRCERLWRYGSMIRITDCF